MTYLQIDLLQNIFDSSTSILNIGTYLKLGSLYQTRIEYKNFTTLLLKIKSPTNITRNFLLLTICRFLFAFNQIFTRLNV